MFTGIVTDIGSIREISGGHDRVVVIETRNALEGLEPGDSVACSGVCLTAVSGASGTGNRFEARISAETLSKTNLRFWTVGQEINLERPLKVGDELGGHIVAGHVDDVAQAVGVTEDGSSRRLRLQVPERLAGFIAPKGSVALDGVSLTVNDVDGREFDVNLIPFTLSATTLSDVRTGTWLNIEVDILARYVARLNMERS